MFTLSIYPLIKEGLIDPSTIIIDAKSGTSGAGRGAKVANLFCEVTRILRLMVLQLTDIHRRLRISLVMRAVRKC